MSVRRRVQWHLAAHLVVAVKIKDFWHPLIQNVDGGMNGSLVAERLQLREEILHPREACSFCVCDVSRQFVQCRLGIELNAFRVVHSGGVVKMLADGRFLQHDFTGGRRRRSAGCPKKDFCFNAPAAEPFLDGGAVGGVDLPVACGRPPPPDRIHHTDCGASHARGRTCGEFRRQWNSHAQRLEDGVFPDSFFPTKQVTC